MNLFDKYMIVKYLKALLAVSMVFVALVAVYLLVEDLDEFIKNSATPGQIARYIVFSIPQLAVHFLPLIILLALVFTVHQMNKWGEVVAMMTSGASLRRIASGFLLVAAVLSVGQFLINEYGATWCREYARRVMEIEIKKNQPSVRGPSWRFVRGAEGRFYYYRFFDSKSQVLHQVEVFQPDEDGKTLKQLILADAGFYQDGEWTFLNGSLQEMANNELLRSESFGNLTMALPETPHDFARLSPHPREMSFAQLMDYLKVMISSGEDPSPYLPELHLKIAFPLSCIVFTFIALSVSLRMKAVNLSFEIGAAVAIAFLYYFLIGVLTELGRNEHLAPWLAGWGAILAFGPIAFVFFWFTRTDYS